MPNLDAARLEGLARDIFVARGVPADDAAWIATMLVRANLRGHDSHGVIRIPQYVTALVRGTLNPKPQMRLVVDTPTVAILDGDGGFGQVVARRGTELAIERTRAQGLAAVALRGAHHVGRLALPQEPPQVAQRLAVELHQLVEGVLVEDAGDVGCAEAA